MVRRFNRQFICCHIKKQEMHTSNRLQRLFFPLIFSLLIFPAGLIAQQVTVKGTVRDQAKNEPLAGVSIQVKGTERGTTTDSLGRFSIAVPGPKSTLTFNYVGYAPQEQQVRGAP